MPREKQRENSSSGLSDVAASVGKDHNMLGERLLEQETAKV